MKRAPAVLIRRGIVTQVVKSGVIVSLDGGETGKVRWTQLFPPDVGRDDALRKVQDWKNGSPLEFVVTGEGASGLILSRIQAIDFPWPDEAFNPAQKRLVTGRVIHITPSYGYVMLSNCAEARVDILAVYTYLDQHGINWSRREVHFDDELEGYLYAVDANGTRISVPSTTTVLPMLELDVLQRLREVGNIRGLSLTATESHSESIPPNEPAEPPSAPRAPTGLKVLVAIHDPDLLSALVARLKARMCQVDGLTDLPSLTRIVERRKNQGWNPTVAFIGLEFPDAETGGKAALLVGDAFPACRVVFLTTSIGDIPHPGANVRASALLSGLVTDRLLEKQLQPREANDQFDDQLLPSADRLLWDDLVRGESAVSMYAASAPRRTPRFGESRQHLRRILDEVMTATRSTRGAVLRMHPVKKEAEILADNGYSSRRHDQTLDYPHLFATSCIGDVLLHKLQYAPANDCELESAHKNHALIIGAYTAMIALPIDATSVYRYALFLLDPRNASSTENVAYSSDDVECARRFLPHFSLAINRSALREHLSLRSGLLQVGLMSISIWHDVAKLLDTVRGFADTLTKACDNSLDEVRSVAEPLAERIQHLYETTGEGLAIALPGREKGPISVLRIVESALAAARTWRDEKRFNGLIVELTNATNASDDYECRGNEFKLERAILNLLINALEQMSTFIGTKGRVVVSLELGPTPETIRKELRTASNTPSSAIPIHSAVISVADTGCGIPGYLREDIFQPLFSTKDVPEGTASGLGLTIAQALVEDDLNGFLYVANAPRFIGATFRIVLPLQRRQLRR